MLLFLPLLLVLPLVLAELDTVKIASETGTAEIAFNSETDCKGNANAPKGTHLSMTQMLPSQPLVNASFSLVV